MEMLDLSVSSRDDHNYICPIYTNVHVIVADFSSAHLGIVSPTQKCIINMLQVCTATAYQCTLKRH